MVSEVSKVSKKRIKNWGPIAQTQRFASYVTYISNRNRVMNV